MRVPHLLDICGIWDYKQETEANFTYKFCFKNVLQELHQEMSRISHRCRHEKILHKY
jgi:hypothetical protein